MDARNELSTRLPQHHDHIPTNLPFDVHNLSWPRSDAGTSPLDDQPNLEFLLSAASFSTFFSKLHSSSSSSISRFSFPFTSTSPPSLHIFITQQHMYIHVFISFCFFLSFPAGYLIFYQKFLLLFFLHFFYFLSKYIHSRYHTNYRAANAGTTKREHTAVYMDGSQNYFSVFFSSLFFVSLFLHAGHFSCSFFRWMKIFLHHTCTYIYIALLWTYTPFLSSSFTFSAVDRNGGWLAFLALSVRMDGRDDWDDERKERTISK